MSNKRKPKRRGREWEIVECARPARLRWRRDAKGGRHHKNRSIIKIIHKPNNSVYLSEWGLWRRRLQLHKWYTRSFCHYMCAHTRCDVVPCTVCLNLLVSCRLWIAHAAQTHARACMYALRPSTCAVWPYCYCKRCVCICSVLAPTGSFSRRERTQRRREIFVQYINSTSAA